MKKFLLGAAAALAIAAPGVAAAQSAYVDLGYQSTDVDVGGVNGDGDGWSIGGATAWGGDGTVGVQLDGVYSTVDGDNGGDADAYNIGGHLFSRNTNHLIGGFAGYGNVDTDLGDFDYWTVGVEGQIYLSRTTLDGAISYSDSDDAESTLTALDLGATHYFTDNFSLGGNVGFGNIETAVGDDDAVTYGIGAEWQFASAPISLFGGWQHSELDDTDADGDTLGIGVRYNWGGSLFDRNRSGASLSRGSGLGRFAGLL